MRRRRALPIATLVAALVTGTAVSAPTATAAPSGERPHYVQLGDSYSAGNGAGSYTEKTCWRSPDNYGAKVAAMKGATYTNAACSGGVLDDILTPREIGAPTLRTRTYRVPEGAVDARARWLKRAQTDRLCGVPEQRDFFYRYSIRSSAAVGDLYTATVGCQLTVQPQINAVSTTTDAVFLTIGGNDIGFTDIVTDCLVLRSAGACKQRMDAADAALPAMKAKTKRVLEAVRERSNGRARVYLLGYPHLINTSTYPLSSTYDAGAELTALQLRGDRLQRDGMAELDKTDPGAYTFVDVKPAWGGRAHGLDPHPVADNRAAWLVPVLTPGREYSEWVHPTAAGWVASALALSSAMR